LIGASERWAGARRPGLPRQRPSAGAGPRRAQRAALITRGAEGRERSSGTLYARLINGDRGGYLSYSLWRRYLRLAQGYTAAHPDGIISYTAHELRHVCASLLIASGPPTCR
jgi:integrase